MLRKRKENGDIEFTPVYFDSATKILINSDKYMLDKSFQGILYRIDNWTNERSCSVIESINGEYVNISIYSTLSENSFIELLNKLRNSMKVLINIKDNDSKYFLWCHIRCHKNMFKNLDYEGVEFLVSKKDCCKIEQKNNICINVFCYENELSYPVYVLREI